MASNYPQDILDNVNQQQYPEPWTSQHHDLTNQQHPVPWVPQHNTPHHEFGPSSHVQATMTSSTRMMLSASVERPYQMNGAPQEQSCIYPPPMCSPSPHSMVTQTRRPATQDHELSQTSCMMHHQLSHTKPCVTQSSLKAPFRTHHVVTVLSRC